MNLQLKENLYCAVAICSLGDWDFNRNRLPRRRKNSPNRLTFLTAPRKDVIVYLRHCEAHEESSMEEKCLLRRGNLFNRRLGLQKKEIATSPKKFI